MQEPWPYDLTLAGIQRDLDLKTKILLRKKVIADEAIVREMLLRWPHKEGKPSLCVGPNHEILGLCVEGSNKIGDIPLILVTPRGP